MKPKTTRNTKNNLLTPQKYSKKNVKFTIDSTDDKITFYAQNLECFPIKAYGLELSLADLEKMGEVIHEEWLKRNTWVHNKLYGYSKLAVPFKELPRDEQDRHKAQIMPAAKLVREYFAGLVDIEELGKKYNVDTSGYFKTKSFKNEG